MPKLNRDKRNKDKAALSGEDKPRKRYHAITGCRLDTVLGSWLIAPEVLAEWRDTGWAIVERGELRSTQARSGELAAQAEAKPYAVENQIARLSIAGPMTKFDTSMSALFGGTSTVRLRKATKAILAAHAAGQVKAVFIDVDSPGGTVEGTAELAAAIRKLRATMPVFVHAEDTAASAALWVGTQGSRFTCGPAAKIGSMGILAQLVDASKAGQDGTVKPIVIDSGKFKAIGAPGRPITPEQRAELQRHVDSLASVFRNDVLAGRPNMTKAQIDEAATARVFIGADAVRVGLCDAVCTSDEAYEYAQQHMNDTPQPVRRGPGEGTKTPAANRSCTMTEAQVRQLQEFAGTGHIVTTDNADAIAVGLCANLRTENQRLTAELEKARKAGKTTASADPELLRSRMEVAVERAQVLMDKNKLTAMQAKMVLTALLAAGTVDMKTGALSEDAQPLEAMFTKAQDGTFPYQKFFAAFDEGKPTDLNKNVTKDQPVGRDTPGEAAPKPFAIDNTGKPASLEEANRIRSMANLPPYTMEQFKAAFPDTQTSAA